MESTAALAQKVVEAVRSVVGRGPVPLHRPFINATDIETVTRVLADDPVGYHTISMFEDELAAACGVRCAVAVSSGTAALHLALLVLGVGPGDVVSVPTLTFAAAAAAVRYTGAAICFDGAGTAPPKAHIGVHLLGRPNPELADWADREFCPLIEDAAEALGSRYNGRPCGSFGVMGVMSFNNNKIVTTGGGGAVLTNDEALAKRVRHLATTAKVPSPFFYEHDAVGFNYRMGTVNAALGLGQLMRLPSILRYKRELALEYGYAFRDIAEPVAEPAGSRENAWLNTCNMPGPGPEYRDALLEAMRAAGLECRALFSPLHMQAPYSTSYYNREAAIAAYARYHRTVLLPSGYMG